MSADKTQHQWNIKIETFGKITFHIKHWIKTTLLKREGGKVKKTQSGVGIKVGMILIIVCNTVHRNSPKSENDPHILDKKKVWFLKEKYMVASLITKHWKVS